MYKRQDLAKRANDIFWPKLNRGGAAGVKPGGTAGNKLDTAGRNTERRKKSKSVSLDIEGIDSGGRQRPMPCLLYTSEPFASLIRERQIPGVGANAQNLRIDKLDRALFAGLRRYACLLYTSFLE